MTKDFRDYALGAGAEIMFYPPTEPEPAPCDTPGCGCVEAFAIRNEALIETVRAIFRNAWPSMA